MRELKVLLLGPPSITRDDTALEITRRKVLALLAYLAVTARPHNRDELSELLYPDQDRDRARADFRQTLFCLRDVMGESWLESGPDGISLRREKGLFVDVVSFREILSRARAAFDPAGRDDGLVLLTRAVRLFRGGFMAGFYLNDSASFDQWQAMQEESLRQDCAAALEKIVDANAGSGRLEAAIGWAGTALSLDPLEEGSHRRLMGLLARAGRRAAALRQFERCRQILAKELGAEPDLETRALRDEIRLGRVAACPAPMPARPQNGNPRSDTPDAQLDGVFLFADVPGSASRRSDQGHRAAALPAEMARLGRKLEAHGGTLIAAPETEVRSVFPTAAAAVTAALRIQLSPPAVGSRGPHTAKSRSSARRTRGPRIAIHAGEAGHSGESDAVTAADRAVLLLRASHRGQILVSGTAVERARDRMPGGAAVRSLGTHQLEDLGPPVSVYQLVHPALPSRFPPLRTLECRRGNLRGQPTSLIGRERELGLLCDLARREEVRVLTLTGPGGAGKTRLALHAAARLSAGFPHGVFFVDLSPLREPDHLVPAIVATLGIREPPGEPRPLFDVLSECLGKKQLLLVLDNFEHLLSAARLVGEIASGCPGVKVLATSREALHVQGEREFPVPPLGLPAAGAAGKDLARCEAVRLFAERARAARPDFAVTEENAPVVAEICARLDGLPLAIELIAARITVVPPVTMRERLSRRQPLLTRGAADLPPRQRTLRSEIAWSYDLLGERDKLVFRRLAIFAGGCVPAAAGTVCAEGTPDDAHATLDCLGALVDKSLLQRQPQADGSNRFRMLETIRDFAIEQLEASGELPVTLRRFSTAALRAAEEAAPNLHGPEQHRWFDLLDAEQDNMHAALAWLSETRSAAEGIRMAASLGWYWFRRGRFTLGEQWLRRFLSIADGSEPPGAPAGALYHLGWIRLMLGCMFYGNSEARDCFRESLALWQRVRHERGEALCLAWLSWCEVDLPMHERCSMADRSVAVARGAGDPWALSFCLKLAHSFLPREDEAGTDKTAALEEAIGLARRTGDPFLICQALHGMGDVHQFLRQDAAAERWYLESLDLAKQIGDTWSIFDTQSHLGWGYANRGELARAAEIFADALRMTAELGARAYVGQYLAGLASIAKREGRGARALRLDGAVSAIRRAEQPGWDLRLAEGTGLTPGAGEKEWKAGSSMTVEQAVEYALGDGD